MPSPRRLAAAMLWSASWPALFAVAPATAATLDIAVSRSGADVIFEGTGAIDLSDFTFAGAADLTSFGSANSASTGYVISGALGAADLYDGFETFAFPSATEDFAFDAAGDMFGFDGSGLLAVTPGYRSGAPLAFTWRVSGASFRDLDLGFGTIAATPSTTVTMTDVSVPLPAGAVLMLTGLGGILLLRRRARPAA